MIKRKIISVILALVMLMAFIPSALASDVQTALDLIDIETIITDLTAVTDDFVLPLKNADETVSFSWSSDDSEVLKIYGKNAIIVSNPKEREVNLTVTAVKGDESEEKSFL